MIIVGQPHYIYTVRPGDTLYGIAGQLGSSVEELERVNFLRPPITDPGLIFPGQVLLVPVMDQPAFQNLHQIELLYIVQPGDTMYAIAQRFNTHVEMLAGLNPEIQDPNLVFVNQLIRVPLFVYEIEEGDSLWRISGRLGIPISTLLEANVHRPGLSPDVIYPGFRLLVPYPSSRNIVVFRPFPGQLISSGERVEGLARAFEANVLHQVRDAAGNVVSEERFTTAAEGAPAFGYFSSSVPFDRSPATEEGQLWVYTRSAADESIQDLVQVQVRFT